MQEKLRISITTYIHFLVDFTCAYWMFHLMMRQYCANVSCPVGETLVDNRQVWPLVYNFCAFGLQLPVGWFVDRFVQKKPWWISSLGCLILAITGGMIFGERVLEGVNTGDLGAAVFYYSDLHILCYSILLGIGNALFHVGAGVEILHLSAQGGQRTLRQRRGRITPIDHMGYSMLPVGVFVSSGALGLFVGQVIARHLELASYVIYDYFQVMRVISLVIIGLMLAAAWLNVLVTKPVNSYQGKSAHNQNVNGSSARTVGSAGRHEAAPSASYCPVWHAGIILLLFLVVVLRSFQGGIMDFPWYSWPKIAFVFALCVTLGKALGGILADRIGIIWTVVVPLSCSALILWLASDYMIPGLIAVLLFQTTMPITLSLMYRQTPGHPGMAFGFLSFGLFLGTLPKIGLRLWKQKQGMTAKQYRVIHFFQDYFQNISSLVAVVSLLLLLILLWLWWKAWKGKSANHS